MLTVKKLNKTYSKRVLQIKKNKKVIDRITPFWGWYSHEMNIKNYEESVIKQIRKLVIDNLYWLIGRDCDKEEWERFIWRKHQGILCGVCSNNKPESVFFNEEEYKTALNSINNK